MTIFQNTIRTNDNIPNYDSDKRQLTLFGQMTTYKFGQMHAPHIYITQSILYILNLNLYTNSMGKRDEIIIIGMGYLEYVIIPYVN